MPERQIFTVIVEESCHVAIPSRRDRQLKSQCFIFIMRKASEKSILEAFFVVLA
jgi:hypothetical protein